MGYALGMNTQTQAERDAAQVIAANVSSMALRMSDYAASDDREAAADALKACVAQSLLGNDYVIVPRHMVNEWRKQLEDVQ